MSALLAVCASGAAHCISTACGGEIVADEPEDLEQFPGERFLQGPVELRLEVRAGGKIVFQRVRRAFQIWQERGWIVRADAFRLGTRFPHLVADEGGAEARKVV